jgi:hypothetical protein
MDTEESAKKTRDIESVQRIEPARLEDVLQIRKKSLPNTLECPPWVRHVN